MELDEDKSLAQKKGHGKIPKLSVCTYLFVSVKYISYKQFLTIILKYRFSNYFNDVLM